MGGDIDKKHNLMFGAIVFLCVIQLAGLAYMRKKFDDGITILQSSENLNNARVTSIETMLRNMQAAKTPVASK